MKRILKTKTGRITLIAVGINLAALYFINQSIQLDTVILYSFIAIAILSFTKLKKQTAMNIAVLGALITTTYNISGQVFGLFSAEPLVLALGALQQGIIAYAISILGGLE